jgi:drug/metabolite transporter (DMT)-like permease
MTQKLRIAILAAVLLWASAFVGIRAGLQDYSPEGLALLRYLVASLTMSIFYFTQSEPSTIRLIDKIKLLLVGVIGIGIYNITLNYGELQVSSGVASFITAQAPVLTTVFAVLFLGESLTLTRILGFVVSMMGVALIAYGEIGAFELSASLSYILAAMLCGSCYSIMQKPFLQKYNAIEATTYVVWGGTLFLLMYLPQFITDVSHASLAGTLTVVYLGIFPAALAYIAWSYILQKMSVAHTVSYLYLMPFAAAVMGWLILDEAPALISVFGAMIAIAGVWLVNQSYKVELASEPDLDPEAEAA